MPAVTADEVLRESLLRAHRLLDTAAPGAVHRLLREADADLKRRLGGVALSVGPDLRFAEAQAMAYQKQIDVVTRYVNKRLLGITHDKALASIDVSVRTTARDLARLNRAFTGIATPLRLREAATMEGITSRVSSSLMGQHATSVDRYGNHMIQQFRTTMRKGLIQGVSSGQMVDALVGHGGPRGPKVSTKARVDPVTGKVIRIKEENIPEGLFARKRYWAQRVVRTEVAHGQNEARLATIARSRDTDFPDMGKKILAMMDNRTAMDSIGVHGQVRPIDGLFQDGAGRQYQRPPARPNDRETIVPWRLAWDETPYSAPMPPAEVARLQQAAEPPGQAKAVAVRQAQGAYRAQLDKKSRRALRAVSRLVGTKLAGTIRPAIAAQRLTEQKADQAMAKARAKAARERARVALEKAEAAAVARVQRYATAQAVKRAKVRQRVQNARALLEAQRKRRRADDIEGGAR